VNLRRPSPGQLAFASLLTALLVGHVVSVFTENVNLDEFVLLARAADTLATGQLASGGRPGLGTLILLPFVRECTDAIAAVRSARLLWVGFTVAFVWGLWSLVSALLRASERRAEAAALAVALLVFVPAFLRYSIQVRTDQPAIALGLWGGVALLASRRSAPWAFLAGLSYGVGFLFSQKLIYVGALTALLASGELLLRREFGVRRELMRLALCAAGGLAVILAYKALVPLFFEPGRLESFAGGMSTFEYYRSAIAFNVYLLMLPTLFAHVVLLALLVYATVSARRTDTGWRSLAVAWAVIALGLAVMLFHAGAFPYFWMTLGLFPAATFAVGLDPIRRSFARPHVWRVVGGSIFTLLVIQAVLTQAGLLQDTQRIQRDSLAFIDRNFDADLEGFHPERALFCRDTADPFPIFLQGPGLLRYWGPERERLSQELIGDFRRRPVVFMLDSFRLRWFPPEIQDFWDSNYQLYYESVWIPRLKLTGPRGSRRSLDVLVPGRYRWQSGDGRPDLRLAGRLIAKGDVVDLQAGANELEFLRTIEGGSLILDLAEPPREAEASFYKLFPFGLFEWGSGPKRRE
jgi:hypothetical protein